MVWVCVVVGVYVAVCVRVGVSGCSVGVWWCVYAWWWVYVLRCVRVCVVFVWVYVVCVHVDVGGCARWGVVCAAYCECGVCVQGLWVCSVFRDQILLVYV